MPDSGASRGFVSWLTIGRFELALRTENPRQPLDPGKVHGS